MPASLLFGIILFLSSWCPFQFSEAAVEIVVNNDLDDASTSVSTCLNNNECSLRSAWLACHTLSTAAPCLINIMDIKRISFDPSLGALELSNGTNIAILGQNTAIVAANWTHNPLIYYDASSNVHASNYPSLNVSNVIVAWFNNSGLGGGAVHFEGEGHLHLSNVVFHQNLAPIGGALYIGSNTLGATVENCTFYENNGENGGAISVWNSSNVVIDNSVFMRNRADGGGGGIYLGVNTTNIVIHNSEFEDNSAGHGAGVMISSSVENVVITQATFINSIADTSGGGIYIHSDNKDINIMHCQFDNCRSEQGGAVMVHTQNSDITISESTFTDCVGYMNHGGGIYLHTLNSGVVIKDNHFTNCIAGLNGGAVYLGAQNTYVTISDTDISDCTAGNGGGVYAELQNHHLNLVRVNFDSNAAQTNGGGAYLSRNNQHANVNSCTFDACTGGDRGGALLVNFGNDDAQIIDTVIENGQAYYGGGIFLGRNKNIRLFNTKVNRCAGTLAGGALYMYDENDGVILYQCELLENTAGTVDSAGSGGAIYSNTLTRGVVLAGCTIEFNRAYGDGGAIFVAGGNEHMLITDTNTTQYLEIIESAHPYANTAGSGSVVIQTETRTLAGVTGFVLHFDAASKLNIGDKVTVYDENMVEVFIIEGDGASGSGWPGIQYAPLRVRGSSFTVELRGYSDTNNPPTSAADGFYGFKLYVAPIVAVPGTPTLIGYNRAEGRGGGIHMAFYVSFTVMTNVQIVSNFAVAGGGGLSMLSAITGTTMLGMEFKGNVASGNGGAMLVESGAGGVYIASSTFERNNAYLDSGGVAFIVSNGQLGIVLSGGEGRVTMRDNRFYKNRARRGAAVFADEHNVLELSNSEVQENQAKVSGGGLHFETNNDLNLLFMKIENNVANGRGGGLALGPGNLLELRSCDFLSNTAGEYGGGMVIDGENDVTLYGDNTFSLNGAGVVGGAVASFNASLWESGFGETRIENNTAQRGSALYYHRMAPIDNGKKLQDLHIAFNQATVGGTVYWLRDGTMTEEPRGLNDNSVTWANNTAPYGERVATQAVTIVGADTYEVTNYGEALYPPLQFSLQDAYGQEMPLEGPTQIVASLASTDHEQCAGRIPVISGHQIEVVNHIASFAKLEVSCAPKGALSVHFEAQLLDLQEVVDIAALSAYSVKSWVELQFRSCRRGEYIKDGECVTCPTGTYSLEYPVTQDTECLDCTSKSGVVTCYGDVIEVSGGYWRRHNTSEAVLDCLGDLNGCAGGNSTGDALCEDGYDGPLCAVCADGYYSSSDTCEKCGGDAELSTTTIVFICIAGLVILIAGFMFYAKCLDGAVEEGVSTMSASEKRELKRYTTKNWIQQQFQDMRAQLKIVITTYQIVSEVPGNLNVQFPSKFTSFLRAFKVFNLNVISVVPFSCTRHYTFIDKLVATTLFPIVLSLLLALLCAVDIARLTFKHVHDDNDTKEKISAVKDQYLTYFFFLTYLVLPSVSTTIFQTFLCTNVDPRDEDNDKYDTYLIADMSISCTSSYYYRGVGYAVAMLLVYVVGIPLMYFLLLYYNREEIAGRDNPPVPLDSAGTDQLAVAAQAGRNNEPPVVPEKGELPSSVKRLAFLWDAYEPQFWYWEVVETTRRLMLTAVLSVCGAGTSVQSIFAVLLGLLYIKLYGYYAPYEKDADDIVAEVGQFQIFFSFLGALIYQNSLLGSQWNDAVSVVLILINATVTILFFYHGVLGLREDWEERKEYLRMRREKHTEGDSWAVYDEGDEGQRLEFTNLDRPAASQDSSSAAPISERNVERTEHTREEDDPSAEMICEAKVVSDYFWS